MNISMASPVLNFISKVIHSHGEMVSHFGFAVQGGIEPWQLGYRGRRRHYEWENVSCMKLTIEVIKRKMFFGSFYSNSCQSTRELNVPA